MLLLLDTSAESKIKLLYMFTSTTPKTQTIYDASLGSVRIMQDDPRTVASLFRNMCNHPSHVYERVGPSLVVHASNICCSGHKYHSGSSLSWREGDQRLTRLRDGTEGRRARRSHLLLQYCREACELHEVEYSRRSYEKRLKKIPIYLSYTYYAIQ